RIETILDHIRKEELRPTHDVVSLLLEACDTVREELRCLKDATESDPAALQAVYERLTQLTQSDATVPEASPDATAPEGGRSARLRVEVDLPEREGITALPLSELYAELGTLGRVEDIQAGSSPSGAPTVSLFLLTAERQQAVRAKLVSLLGTENVRVERQHTPPRPGAQATAALTGRAARAEATAFGLFDQELSSIGSNGTPSGSATQTGVFDTSALGRRSVDHDPNQSGF